MRVATRRRYVKYFDGLGILKFAASTNHSTVLSYDINVYTYQTTTLVVTRNIGKPTPDTNNDIIHDCTAMLAPLASTNYTMKVAANFSSGVNESTAGDDFSLPLS